MKGTWGKLKATGRVSILDDSLSTTKFAAAVSRVSGMPARQRVRQPKSLGEILVIAHASVYAQDGVDVFILMDEGDGRRRAKEESDWLTERGHRPLSLWSTPQVLRDAVSPAFEQCPGGIRRTVLDQRAVRPIGCQRDHIDLSWLGL